MQSYLGETVINFPCKRKISEFVVISFSPEAEYLLPKITNEEHDFSYTPCLIVIISSQNETFILSGHKAHKQSFNRTYQEFVIKLG